MKVLCLCREPTEKQVRVLGAFASGVRATGDHASITVGVPDPEHAFDVVTLFGIGGDNRAVSDLFRRSRKRTVIIDKGYTDRNVYYRISVDELHPLRYLGSADPPSDRWNALGLTPAPYSRNGNAVLFDGASNKYCRWCGLGDWVAWGARTVEELRRHTRRPVLYRPRPSHNGVPSLPGVETHTGSLADAFARAAVVVSHGGNIGFDATLAGKPHVALAASPARPISETDLNRLDEPRIPTDAERMRWLRAVAWCQWTLAEIEDGTAWTHIRTLMP